MTKLTKPCLAKIILTINATYEREISEALLDLFYYTLKDFDENQVRQAFMRHLTDPDRGQFMPKPADIIRQIKGTSEERRLILEGRANVQWAIALKKIGSCGMYNTPKFDDPTTVTVIAQMGGWINFCNMLVDQQPYRHRDFVKLYQTAATSHEHEYGLGHKLFGIEAQANTASDPQSVSPFMKQLNDYNSKDESGEGAV